MKYDMNIRSLNDNVRVIVLAGEIDLYSAPKLKQEMAMLLESGIRQVIIDLSSVEYLDSTGLGVIIGGLRRIKEKNGSLSLVGLSPLIRRVIEITRLNDVFDIYNTESEAFKAMVDGE